MKKIDKCLLCDDVVKYDEKSNKMICTNCKTEYEANLFKSEKKIHFNIKFKRYGILIAILSALYLLWLIYRIFLY